VAERKLKARNMRDVAGVHGSGIHAKDNASLSRRQVLNARSFFPPLQHRPLADSAMPRQAEPISRLMFSATGSR